MGFSRSVFVANEGDGSVHVCAELFKGELGTSVSLSVETGLGIYSGSCPYDVHVSIRPASFQHYVV